MIRSLRPWLAAALALLCAGTSPIVLAAPAEPAPPVRVLFVGNSLTNRNDLPATFAAYVARAYPGRRVEAAMVAPDGRTLEGHRRDGEAEARIAGARWDYVVLQEGRDIRPGYSVNGERFYSEPTLFFAQAAYFAARARERGAVPVFFETWGAGAGQAYLEYAYTRAARDNDARLAPVGRVFARLAASTDAGLLAEDGSHPSRRGTEVAAATIAATLFGPPADAAALEPRDRAAIVAALADAGDAKTPLPPRPAYSRDPVPALGQVPTAQNTTGRWRARDGGFRLSLGTQIALAWPDGQPVVTLRVFETTGVLESTTRDVRRNGASLAFDTFAGGQRYQVRLWPAADGLQVLTAQTGDGATFTTYEQRTYAKDGEAAYFDALDRRYAALARDAARDGLAAALPGHVEAVTALVGRDALAQARQGFPVSEWDLILLAGFHAQAGQPQRALDCLQAAVTLYPQSTDAWANLAKGEADAGHRSAAITAYDKALALNAGGNPVLERMLREALARLRDGG